MDEVDADDIFGDYEQNLEGDENRNGQESTEAGNGEIVPIPKKRVVRNPRLKFDADKLCGERGLPILLDHFSGCKFKGKGHELEDLNQLLSALEHWTHRLFPSMRFEDCLLQIEKLGKKKPVQTCVQKIRMDMPILAKDFIGDDDNDDVLRIEDDPPMQSAESAFDQLLNDHRESTSFGVNEGASTSFGDVSNDFDSNPISNVPSTQTKALSEEQKARMERNRQLAAERLKARLSRLTNNDSNIDEESESQNQETSKPESSVTTMDITETEDIPRKPKKRLRIESSSSEEDVSIDDLVEESLYDEQNNDNT